MKFLRKIIVVFKDFLVRVTAKVFWFFVKSIRFIFSKLWGQLSIILKKIQSIERIHSKVLWLNKKFVAFKIFVYTVITALPGFYSEFVRVYSVMFWVRVTLIIGFYPIKLFFTLLLYPFFLTYWANGAAFYVIFSMICSLIYLAILWPRFIRNFLKGGDVYIFFLIQIFYFETCYSMPIVYIYFEPFYFDGLMLLARVYESYIHMSKCSLPFDGTFIRHWAEVYIRDDNPSMVDLVPKNSPLKPVSNRLAPSELYKLAVERSTAIYGLENPRFVEYFIKRHLPVSWENRATYAAEIQGFYEFMEEMSPTDRCMIWNSDMTPFDEFFDFLVREGDPESQEYEEEQSDIDEWEEDDDIPDLFTWYWYTYRFIKRPDAPRLPVPNARMLRDILSTEIKGVPPYVLELLKVPEIEGLEGTFASRRFERLVRANLHSHANRVNSRLAYKVRSFFDTPGWAPELENEEGFYIELRAQRKVDGIHVTPVLVTRRFNRSYFVYPGTTLYHQLYMTHSDYQTRKDLQFLEKWSAFFSPRYPFNSAPLLFLDKIFANNSFLGLVVNFLDPRAGELNYFGRRRPWVLESSAYYNRKTPLRNYYSPLQRDFSPTYNLDILAFMKRLPGHENSQSLYIQFSPGSDLNPVDMSHSTPSLGASEFKILTLYGQRGLVFTNFLRYSFYKNLVDQQWNLFMRDKMYDPLTGKLCWTLGTQVWTWGVSPRFINDSRMINIYNSNFGVTAPRRVPYPTRFYMPLMRQVEVKPSPSDSGTSLTKYSQPLQQFETYYIPYQFDRWDGPHGLDEYQTVQGGYYLRTLQDPRSTKSMRFNKMVSYSRLDPVFTDNLLFNTRGLLNNPIIKGGMHYTVHRSYDRFNWPPTYMNNEMRKYKPKLVRPADLDFDKQPWDIDLKYVWPGYNKRVPRYLITRLNDDEPGSGYALTIAYYLSIYYDFDDYISPIIAECKKAVSDYYSSFNRRWASYYIRSQVTWRKNGSKYHDFDMWWNDKVDFIVSRERTDIIGRGLWAYRVNDIHFRLRGRRGFFKSPVQQKYFRWCADLIDFYFDVIEFRAPQRIHKKFGDPSNLTAQTLNTPVGNYPKKTYSTEPYKDLQPPVVRALDNILYGVMCLMEDKKLDYQTAGKEVHKFMKQCRKKYPDKWLYEELMKLLAETEAIRPPKLDDHQNFLDWPGRRGRTLDHEKHPWMVKSYTVEKEITAEKAAMYADLARRRALIAKQRGNAQHKWEKDWEFQIKNAPIEKARKDREALQRWIKRRILPW